MRAVRLALRRWWIAHYALPSNPLDRHRRYAARVLLALLLAGGWAYETEYRAAEARKQAHLRQQIEFYESHARTLWRCMAAGENGEQGGFYMSDTQKAYECSIKPL